MPLRSAEGAERPRSFAGPRLHYAWVVLAVTFICLLTAAAVRSLPGILTRPLEAEFGWNRAAIGLAVSINVLLFGLSGPLLGRVMDRVGPRLVAAAATVFIAGGAAGTLAMSRPWHMDVLWGLVVGAGSGGATMVMGSAVANRWFTTQRGLALGILGAATSAGDAASDCSKSVGCALATPASSSGAGVIALGALAVATALRRRRRS